MVRKWIAISLMTGCVLFTAFTVTMALSYQVMSAAAIRWRSKAIADRRAEPILCHLRAPLKRESTASGDRRPS